MRYRTMILALALLSSMFYAAEAYAAEPEQPQTQSGPDRADTWVLERDAGYAGDVSKKVHWCDFWSATAMYGARAMLLGRNRALTWASREQAEDSAEQEPNKSMYAIEDGNTTPHEKSFIEELVFAGYDWAKQQGAGAHGMPDEVMKNRLMDACMAKQDSAAAHPVYVASSHHILEQQCNADAWTVHVMWELMFSYGKTPEQATEIVNQSHEPALPASRLARILAWASAYAHRPEAGLRDYAYAACMGEKKT